MLLSEKVCIITGAASARGIGRATARMFATGRPHRDPRPRGGGGQAAAPEIGEAHRGLACDVTDKAACVAAVAR